MIFHHFMNFQSLSSFPKRHFVIMNNERRTPLHGGELLSFSGTIQHEDHRIDPASFGPSSPIETSLLHRCTQVEALSKESRKPSSLVRLTFPFFFFCSISFLNCTMGRSRPQRPTEPTSTEVRMDISLLPFANGWYIGFAVVVPAWLRQRMIAFESGAESLAAFWPSPLSLKCWFYVFEDHLGEFVDFWESPFFFFLFSFILQSFHNLP